MATTVLLGPQPVAVLQTYVRVVAQPALPGPRGGGAGGGVPAASSHTVAGERRDRSPVRHVPTDSALSL